MTASPSLAAEGTVRAAVYSDREKLAGDGDFVSIKVVKALNRIPQARIVLDDGDMPARDFPLSAKDQFKPGAPVKITAGYGNNEDIIFEGVVVRHSIKVTQGNYSRLIVDCRDRAIAMTTKRNNTNFVDMSDSDVIARLVGKYQSKKLSSGVASTTYRHRELVQFYCSDWDFLVSRAEMAGQVVSVEAGRITTAEPTTGPAALQLGWGNGLIEFHGDIDARTQYANVRSVSWDAAAQDVIVGGSPPVDVGTQGDLGARQLATDIGNDELLLQSTTLGDKTVLDGWARSRQLKAALSRVCGRVRFDGNAAAAPGATIEIDGVGPRFNGAVYVSAVSHEIGSGNWTTEAEFGMSPDWFTERSDVVAPAAGGFTPAVNGLQIGVVKQLDQDPDGEFRIQVALPVLQAETPGVWARLASFYGSSGVGACFVPELNDEVVLGYFNNDPGAPVVLGSLYSAKRTPPFAEGEAKSFDGQNVKKGVVTRGKLRLEFDDEKPSVTVATPGSGSIVLDDSTNSIVVTDQNGNAIELQDSGITLTSKGDVVIDAGGGVQITGGSGVELGTAGASTTIQGQRVDIN